MSTKVLMFAVALSVISSGCVTHYRYESNGEVTSSSGNSSRALLYWFGDDGGLWNDDTVLDSNVTMRVCKGIPRNFVANEADRNNLYLASAPGDRQVASRNADGNLVELPQVERLRTGQGNCGQLEVRQKPTTIETLNENIQPDVVILCDNSRNADSYPKHGRYAFSAIQRYKVEGQDDREPGDVCNE